MQRFWLFSFLMVEKKQPLDVIDSVNLTPIRIIKTMILTNSEYSIGTIMNVMLMKQLSDRSEQLSIRVVFFIHVK